MAKAIASITLTKQSAIQSITRFYRYVDAMADAPAKPSTLNPGADWSTTEPTYVRGVTQIQYYVDRVVYTSGEGSEKFSYSDVSQASSFEAAKAAFAEAQQAMTKIDNLEIGGRNLLLDTDAPSLTKVVDSTRIFNIDRTLKSLGYSSNPRSNNHLAYVDMTNTTYKEVAPVTCTHGVRFYSDEADWSTATQNPNFAFTFYDFAVKTGSGLKIQPNKQYTISCYIKATQVDIPTTGNNGLGSSELGELVLGQDVVGGDTYQGILNLSLRLYGADSSTNASINWNYGAIKFMCSDRWERASFTITAPSWNCTQQVESKTAMKALTNVSYGQIVCVTSNTDAYEYYIYNGSAAANKNAAWSPIDKNTFAASIKYAIQTIPGVKIYLCGFQCEEGNMATAWHLAPEEEEYLRSLAQQKAQEAATTASSAQKAAANSATEATNASTAATLASQRAETAVTQAGQAVTNATTALENANTAKNQADAAKTAADNMATAYDQAIKNLEIIVGLQTAATNEWIGVVPFSTLVDKQQIVYWLPVDSKANATLSLYTSYTSKSNNTSVKLEDGSAAVQIPIYYGGSTRLGTQYGKGNVVRLVFRKQNTTNGQVSTDGWWCDANYNTNNDTYNRMRMQNNITASSKITAKSLIVASGNGYIPLTQGCTFDVTRPILYAGSDINKNQSGNNNYLSINSVPIGSDDYHTTSAGCKEKQTIFLCGELHGTTFKVHDVNGQWLTTEPNLNGMYYISIGYMETTSSMYLYPEHPVYICNNGELQSLNQVAYDAKLEVKDVSELMDPLLTNWDRVHGDYVGKLQKTPMLPSYYPIIISCKVTSRDSDKQNGQTLIPISWCSNKNVTYEEEDIEIPASGTKQIDLLEPIPSGDYTFVAEFDQSDSNTQIKIGNTTLQKDTPIQTATLSAALTSYSIVIPSGATNTVSRIRYLIIVPTNQVLTSSLSVQGSVSQFYINGLTKTANTEGVTPEQDIVQNTSSITSVLGCNYVWGPTISELKLSGRTNVNDMAEKSKTIEQQLQDLNFAQSQLTDTMSETYISQAAYKEGIDAIDRKYSQFQQYSDGFEAVLGLEQKIIDNDTKLTDISNHLKYDTEGLHLFSTGQGSGISTTITETGMEIKARDRTVAEFKDTGMEIPRATVTTSLALGNIATGGFYDLINLNGGIAWKWRDITQ